MDTAAIISALKSERDRLGSPIAALEGTEIHGRKATGNGRRRNKKRLSTAARKRISRAAKARWAKARQAGRNRL